MQKIPHWTVRKTMEVQNKRVSLKGLRLRARGFAEVIKKGEGRRRDAY